MLFRFSASGLSAFRVQDELDTLSLRTPASSRSISAISSLDFFLNQPLFFYPTDKKFSSTEIFLTTFSP